MRYYYLQRRTTAEDTGLGSVPGRPFRVLLVTREVGLLCPYRYLPFPKSQIREGNGTPLQYSCLENPMDGGAWQAAVHGVTKSWTRLGDFTFTFHFHALEKEMATHSSCSCLENPRDGGASWAAVCGVAQSQTCLKRLSSSILQTCYQLFFSILHFSRLN